MTMHPVFYIPSRGIVAFLADCLMLPVMYLLFLMLWGESPQLTHWWNNVKFERSVADHMDRSMMISCKGDPKAKPRTSAWDIAFHLGGWPSYIVLEPVDYHDKWYVGWVSRHGGGASQIPIRGRVRMLIGPDDVEFFGVKAKDHKQIKLREVARGRLGDRGAYRRVPLH